MNENECNSLKTMNNALNEFHLIKDGVLDKEQLNYIVKNPEEPKCKYTITSLLNLYQKEKRKTLCLTDSNVTYKEFKNFVAENIAKTKITPEAAVKLKDLPDELCEKIVKCLIDNHAIVNEQKPEASSSTSRLIQVKKERCEQVEESEEEEDGESSANISRTEETSEMAKTGQKASVQKKSKGRSQKSEPSLCESMFYVAVNRAQSNIQEKAGKSRKKGDSNLPSVVKEFESLLDKESQLAKDGQKIDKCLANIEKEKKKAENELEKAEKKFNDNMQKLMQALMLCDSLNEIRDKAKERCSNVQQRMEDLEVLKKKIAEQRSKVDERKSELLVFVIRESSATATSSSDQSESVEILNSDTSLHTSKNDDEEIDLEKILRQKKKSANKRLQELASELDIGAVSFASEVSTKLPEQQNEGTSTSEKAKSWKENYVTMSINTNVSPKKSSFSFQEVPEKTNVSETVPKRVSESSTVRSPSVTRTETSDKKTKKSEKEPEERRKRPNSELSERRSKITKFVDGKPCSSTSSQHSSTSESRTNIDNELVAPKGFNAFRDIANCGLITTIKVHKDFLYIASDTGYLRKFNVNNLKNNLFFDGHPSAIQAFTLHKITDALYTGCDDGKLRHFDSKTAKLKDSFYLCCPVSCMEEGKTVLYIGLQNGIVYRFGFMSNKIINSYTVSSRKLLAIKLLAEYSEESRIIVCCANEISVRNSSNGALLNAFPNSENLGFLNVFPNGFIYFLSFNPSKRGAVLNVRHEKNQLDSRKDGEFIDPRVTAFEICDDHFYFGTYTSRIVCLRQINDKYELEWIFILPTLHTYVTAFAIHGDTLLAAVSDGTVMKVGLDANGPHCCRERFCNNKPFARREDLEAHVKLEHWVNARRGTLYQCHRDNCRSVMSSSEVRRPYHQRPSRSYYNYPRRSGGYHRRR